MNIELFDSPVVRKLLYILLVVVFVYFLVQLIKKAFNRLIDSTDNKYRARKAVNILGYILVVTAALFIYNEQLGTLGLALGVTGAGIAFALQEVIVSFAGWIYIVFTNKIVVGQRIKVGEMKGDIIDISVLSTTLMEMGDWVNGDLYNGRIVNISNSFVFKQVIQNYSAEYPFLWDELTIPITHNSDFHFARKMFKEIAQSVCGEYARNSAADWKKMTNKFRIENAEVDPMVSLVFDENWITFTIRYIVDYKKRRSTKDAIYSEILDAIGKNQNKIRIATAAIQVTTPAVKSPPN